MRGEEDTWVETLEYIPVSSLGKIQIPVRRNSGRANPGPTAGKRATLLKLGWGEGWDRTSKGRNAERDRFLSIRPP